jgi:hypothetical protein
MSKKIEIPKKEYDVLLQTYNDNELSIVKEEYEKLWNYYIQSIQERFKLFDWYFKIVTIPFSLFASISFIFGKKTEFAKFNDYFSLILFAIFLIGLCIYIIYSKQNALALKYDISINKIREYYRDKYTRLSDILVIDKLRQQKGFFNGMGSIKLWRGLIIVFFNSIISTIALALIIDTLRTGFIVIAYLTIVIIHVLIYLIMNNNYLSKNKK